MPRRSQGGSPKSGPTRVVDRLEPARRKLIEVPDVLVGDLLAPRGHRRPRDAVRDEGEELRVGVQRQVLAEVRWRRIERSGLRAVAAAFGAVAHHAVLLEQHACLGRSIPSVASTGFPADGSATAWCGCTPNHSTAPPMMSADRCRHTDPVGVFWRVAGTVRGTDSSSAPTMIEQRADDAVPLHRVERQRKARRPRPVSRSPTATPTRRTCARRRRRRSGGRPPRPATCPAA